MQGYFEGNIIHAQHVNTFINVKLHATLSAYTERYKKTPCLLNINLTLNIFINTITAAARMTVVNNVAQAF